MELIILYNFEFIGNFQKYKIKLLRKLRGRFFYAKAIESVGPICYKEEFKRRRR